MIKLQVANRQSVLKAIRECDDVGRDDFLLKYGYRRARGHFLVYKGQEYDSKAILGVAHGIEHGESALEPSEFSGGDSAASSILKKLGFSVRGEIALPNWSDDELILVLDAYLGAKSSGKSVSTNECEELSLFLRQLPIFADDLRASPRFRNQSSVMLKILNYCSIDPDVKREGMSHGAKCDLRICNEWVGEEGKILYRLHRSYERNRKIVKLKKNPHLARMVD